MEEEISRKQIKISIQFYESFEQIYDFGFETFGYVQSDRYIQKIINALATLPSFHMVYSECGHLVTKSRMYRNIILGSHLIIYRITNQYIEVLDIIHSASSIGKIRAVRSIRL